MRQIIARAFVFVLLALIGSTALPAESVDLAKVPPKLQAAITSLKGTLRDSWQLYEIDQEPSVAINGQQGYRIVFRRSWNEHLPGTNLGQAAAAAPPGKDGKPFVTKHEDWHFVLVPENGVQLPDEAKREILWHVADEKQFRLPVALGVGRRFTWFTYASIPSQYFVREQLALSGGDDPLQLALRGLRVEDEGTMTRLSMERLIVKFGDKGFAALNEMTHVGEGESKVVEASNAIRAMIPFRDARATARLIELYNSRNPEIRKIAAYALIHKPFRLEAKEAYFDMLRTRLRASEVMEMCVELGWTDAAPLVQEIVAKPTSLRGYLQAFKVSRQLAGKPIDAKLLDAEKTIRRQGGFDRTLFPTEQELAEARLTIQDAADIESAAVVGLGLSIPGFKVNNQPVNKDGIDILRALPKPVVGKMLEGLLNGLEDDKDRRAIIKLQQQVS